MNIRAAIATAVAALLFANVAITGWITVWHRTNIGTGELIFGRDFISIPRGILMRHWTNIRAGEDLPLAAALLARVIIFALRGMDIRT